MSYNVTKGGLVGFLFFSPSHDAGAGACCLNMPGSRLSYGFFATLLTDNTFLAFSR